MLVNPTIMVIEEEINSTMTLVVKEDGSNDEEGKNDNHTEISSKEEHIYTLLTSYQSTRDEFKLKDTDPHNIVNK